MRGPVSEDLLLPAQIAPASGVRDLPEFALAQAVLWTALDDIRGGSRSITRTGGAQAALAAEARTWIAADDWAWPFSFVNVCAMLDLDPAAIRAALRRQRAA